MADDSTRRDCGTDRNEDDDLAADRWPGSDPVLEAELPPDLRVALGRFLGTGAVETLADWVAAVRRHTGGGSLSIDDLCVTDGETGHRATLDGERYRFACFYDAVILAALVDRPVDVRTESPLGAVIEARAVGTDELTVTPEGATFSFGIDESVEPPTDARSSVDRGYAAICPYVKAFPTLEAYERWAASVPAATVALPLAGATDLAAALVR